MEQLKAEETKLKELAEKEQIFFRKHALLRMQERQIKVKEVKEALLNGQIIEIYPEDTPLPSKLILGWTVERRPLHIVLAIDKKQQAIWVITVYEPSLEIWAQNFRQRRKK